MNAWPSWIDAHCQYILLVIFAISHPEETWHQKVKTYHLTYKLLSHYTGKYGIEGDFNNRNFDYMAHYLNILKHTKQISCLIEIIVEYNWKITFALPKVVQQQFVGEIGTFMFL